MVKFVEKIKQKVTESAAKAKLIAQATKLKQDSTLEDLVTFLENAAPLLQQAEGIELKVHRNQKTPDGKIWDAIILIKQHKEAQQK